MTRFEMELSGALGAYWKESAEKELEEVRYCLSVNDNKGENSMANLLFNGAENLAPDERPVSMDGFKFYNNTLINCTQAAINALSNAYIANNIFVGKSPLSSTVWCCNDPVCVCGLKTPAGDVGFHSGGTCRRSSGLHRMHSLLA